MRNDEIALIYKAISYLLDNQARILRDLDRHNTYAIDSTNELAVEYGKLAEQYWKDCEDNKYEVDTDSVINHLDQLKEKRPGQIISVAIPNHYCDFKIGDALIYEDMHGKITFDCE